MCAQILQKFYFRTNVGAKSLTWLQLNVCWCRLHQQRVNINKRNHNGGCDDFLINCNIDCKKHTTDLALIASSLSQAVWQGNCTRKWWFSTKMKHWNFSENKLLTLINLMKMDFLLVGLNLNIIIQKKSARKMHVLCMIH